MGAMKFKPGMFVAARQEHADYLRSNGLPPEIIYVVIEYYNMKPEAGGLVRLKKINGQDLGRWRAERFIPIKPIDTIKISI
jgi:hypothetical protein